MKSEIKKDVEVLKEYGWYVCKIAAISVTATLLIRMEYNKYMDKLYSIDESDE